MKSSQPNEDIPFDSPAANASNYFQPVDPEHIQFLVSLQHALQLHYDIEPPYCISEFVCHSAQTETGSSNCKGTTPEMLVYREDGTNLDISLFLNPSLLTGIDNNTCHKQWSGEIFDNGCIVLEGVSHFLYLIFNAHHDRQVSMLDLEIQAEIDKFIFAALNTDYRNSIEALLDRLFYQISYREDLSPALKQRYEQANDLACKYCQWLSANFVLRFDDRALSAELARIYRLNGTARQQHINRVTQSLHSTDQDTARQNSA